VNKEVKWSACVLTWLIIETATMVAGMRANTGPPFL